MFKVAEKFISINGESRRAGELAVFIRLGGCNLNCTYCDTAWAIPKDGAYEQESCQSILEYVKKSEVDNVTITGGEPLLYISDVTGDKVDNIENLVAEILALNKRVEIETNGAVDIQVLYEMSEELSLRDELSITLDYKCPDSGMEDFMLMKNYEYLRKYDTVKFVVMSLKDLDKARQVIQKYNLVERGIAIYLSPVFGKIEPREIVEYMIDNKMNGVRNQLQQHKFIWPPEMRGV